MSPGFNDICKADRWRPVAKASEVSDVIISGRPGHFVASHREMRIRSFSKIRVLPINQPPSSQVWLIGLQLIDTLNPSVPEPLTSPYDTGFGALGQSHTPYASLPHLYPIISFNRPIVFWWAWLFRPLLWRPKWHPFQVLKSFWRTISRIGREVSKNIVIKEQGR